jgi:hypothetical protein
MGVQREAVISVVAGGWSVNEVDLASIPGYIIGVNDSAYRLPRVDAVVSMDRKWAENRQEFILSCGKPTYLRDVATRVPELRDAPNVTLYKCNNEVVSFGPTPIYMNGTSSATVALNLAYIMWPEKAVPVRLRHVSRSARRRPLASGLSVERQLHEGREARGMVA